MKTVDWDGSLSVEVDEIDEDHRRLVELFNLLSESVAHGADGGYTDALLEELVSCTVWHFRHEERLMLQYGYPAAEEHKQEHQELLVSAQAMQQMLVEAKQTVSTDHIVFLEQWLTGHILGADMDLGRYLAEKM